MSVPGRLNERSRAYNERMRTYERTVRLTSAAHYVFHKSSIAPRPVLFISRPLTTKVLLLSTEL